MASPNPVPAKTAPLCACPLCGRLYPVPMASAICIPCNVEFWPATRQMRDAQVSTRESLRFMSAEMAQLVRAVMAAASAEGK